MTRSLHHLSLYPLPHHPVVLRGNCRQVVQVEVSGGVGMPRHSMPKEENAVHWLQNHLYLEGSGVGQNLGEALSGAEKKRQDLACYPGQRCVYTCLCACRAWGVWCVYLYVRCWIYVRTISLWVWKRVGVWAARSDLSFRKGSVGIGILLLVGSVKGGFR